MGDGKKLLLQTHQAANPAGIYRSRYGAVDDIYVKQGLDFIRAITQTEMFVVIEFLIKTITILTRFTSDICQLLRE